MLSTVTHEEGQGTTTKTFCDYNNQDEDMCLSKSVFNKKAFFIIFSSIIKIHNECSLLLEAKSDINGEAK